MTKLPLHLGPLKADGFKIHRSGVRWLAEPGQMCRANEVIAYFSIGMIATEGRPKGPEPFAEEILQVACATRVAGRLHYDPATAPGGYLSFVNFNPWDPDIVLGYMETDGTSPLDKNATNLRLLMLARRRMTPLVDVHAGLLPGWNSRSRAWWCDAGETPVTLLSLGICDVTGLIMGENCNFFELFESETAPSQFVFIPDHPIAPSTPVLLDQIKRSPAQFQAISADLHASLSKSATLPTANDWMFAGTLLSSMERSPITETTSLLSASGVIEAKTAEVVLLSLSSEPSVVLRHKALGYHLHFLTHHQAAAGPAIRAWLAGAFERVVRTPGDIQADYEKLIDAVEKTTRARILILNRMSTSGDETISSYAPFDAPLSGTLSNVAAKELNLMLHNVSAGRNVSILDVDAIAAEIGGGEHLPDGIHQSKNLQAALREEILHVLRELRPQG